MGLVTARSEVPPAALVAQEQTWVEVDGTVYGAKPDDRGPIGGGTGNTVIVTSSDYTVGKPDALSKAKAGQVVFIPGETDIDLTARIYIEQLVLDVPAGVTLAGNRGQDGSMGANLTSDAMKTPVMIRAMGRPIFETRDAPITSSGQKIGRNDPCPCDSGKKYKKCYLKKQ